MSMRCYITILFASALCLAGCGRAPSPREEGALKVSATTSILGDVVSRVGGPHIRLTVLIKPGQEPHSFNPAPADLVGLTHSQLLFANGLGLEGFLPRLPPGPRIVEVSRGLPVRRMGEQADSAGHDGHDGHVAAWTRVISDALAAADPAHAADYDARAEAYRRELFELDAWIAEQTALIPAERRLLVADHAVLGYFADRYRFAMAGVIVPSFSTEAEPSARDLARLESVIRERSIPALFVTRAVSPALGQRVAADTGARLAFFYDGTLSGPDGPAPTYLDFMRHNVSVFVKALGE
jgi:ABC-type Zn uptake system ZnuABC Zn-binding protein ZnuA